MVALSQDNLLDPSLVYPDNITIHYVVDTSIGTQPQQSQKHISDSQEVVELSQIPIEFA